MAETQSPDQRERSRVFRLDVRLDAVESLDGERVPQCELEGLAGEPVSGGRGIRVETAVETLQEAANNLAQVDDGDQRVVDGAPPASETKSSPAPRAISALKPAASEGGLVHG